ncbi:pilus biosynthesis protein TadE [Alsobacter metallidurans]|uniref:Pilus biosynthesis protein TadE n=1 Tax=Alsobacter metallidurans TaxID=340221 RepID=A0A917IAK8_9HYPH|nr:TadE/TadG family type IV pilus assembly protein [Alsobacter metallidurans]GGH26351.1 pilus biosynthesis protein TadE [Alsobacter metallidurans]
MRSTWLRFKADKRGSTAVEFGLIATPLVASFLMIIEMGAAYWAGASLDLAAFRAGEAIRTRVAVGMDPETFRSRFICPSAGIMTCRDINIQVDAMATFDDAPPPSLTSSSFNTGGLGQSVAIQLSYPFPVFVNYITAPVISFNGRRALHLSAASAIINPPPPAP